MSRSVQCVHSVPGRELPGRIGRISRYHGGTTGLDAGAPGRIGYKEMLFVTGASIAMGREDPLWQAALMHGAVFCGGANEIAESMIHISSLVLPGLPEASEVVAHL